MRQDKAKPFYFKQFTIHQDRCRMKVGTDGVLLGAWADISGVSNILDIGAGSGLVAIMLAQRTEQAIIHAVEIDSASAKQAAENMRASPWKSRLKVFHTAVQDYVPFAISRYGLIVSNPPFFSGGTFSQNQDRNSVRHTIKLPHGDLLAAVRSLLAPEGRFCVILPFLEGLRFQELAQSYNLHCTRMAEVYPRQGSKLERLLMQFEKQPKAMRKSILTIHKGEIDEWTDEYVQLTGAFYLKM
ncbi:MAG: methyltransferase [Phaeodactylibacter sp.]|nr:methyltransferase [Phaeodactylibacter sp.]